MTRYRRHVFIIITISVAVAVIIGHGIYYWKKAEKENKILSTNKLGYAEFEIPHADSLIVGKWQSTDKPQWYKVYYDDYDEEQQLFWGKEWDESEDVTEEDLNYHRNGWFRWEKKVRTCESMLLWMHGIYLRSIHIKFYSLPRIR